MSREIRHDARGDDKAIDSLARPLTCFKQCQRTRLLALSRKCFTP
uniref:Uncharacterized protein n=1 Tax=Rhizophora mucronata TaxID=61149 RepID=A0A2P2NW61_RHIMU